MRLPSLFLTALSLAGQSAPAPRPWTPVLEADLAASAAPDGIQLNLAASLRRTWRGSEPEPEACLQAGALGAVNPAFGHAGLFLEVQPAPFLLLRAEAEGFRYFGSRGSLLSFDRADAGFGSRELDARKGQEESTGGRRLVLQATPQVQAGHLAFRHQVTASFWRFGGRGPWFYEADSDTLLRDGDRVLDQQSLLCWAFRPAAWTFWAGITYQDTRARAAGLLRQRAGLTCAFEAAEPRPGWGRLRGGVVVGRNLEDRNRKGDLYAMGSVGTRF